MSLYKEIFPREKSIIGMIHLPPMPGYSGYAGTENIKRRILREARILQRGGVDAIMVENNYDLPHREFVRPLVRKEMITLIGAVVDGVDIPVGVDVLWNDYKSALRICQATGARFIRVAAFVDSVRTRFAPMTARADRVMRMRKRLGLEDTVVVMADVQVKHSEMMKKNKKLSTSVLQALSKGADAIIVTGTWTGVAPILDHLETAQTHAPQTPIIVGSGSTADNLAQLFDRSDCIIVGTAIMKDGIVRRNRLKAYMDAYKKYMGIRKIRRIEYNEENI